MEKLRNSLQANCWEAGGCQLPSYITTLTVSPADGEGGKRLEARKMSIETRKKREEEKQKDRPEKQSEVWRERRKKKEKWRWCKRGKRASVSKTKKSAAGVEQLVPKNSRGQSGSCLDWSRANNWAGFRRQGAPPTLREAYGKIII